MAHVTKLIASNFKKLRAVSIDFDGAGVVQISGENAAGKSSVLDAIFAALGGKNAAPETPIRRGEKRADIEIHLDDPKVIVRRVFTAEGSTSLTIESRDGAPFSSPQRMLDELLGKLSFDPLAFSRMKPKERVEVLLSVVDLKADPAQLERLAPGSTISDPLQRLAVRFKAVYEERTIAGRIVDQVKGELAAIPEEADDDPIKGVNVVDLVRQRDELAAKRAAQENARRQRADVDASAKSIEAQIAKLQAEHAQLKGRLVDMDAAIKTFDDHGPAITALEDKVEAAEGINERFAQVLRRREISNRLAAQEEKVQEATDQLDAIKAYREQLVAAAKMPVPGLGWTEGDVTFGGLPFDQASHAEQIRISAAIGMALNPKLRLMQIDDGSLLSEKSLALLGQIAIDHDFQVLVETVDTSGKVGIVIEDGAVVADNRTAALPKAEVSTGEVPF